MTSWRSVPWTLWAYAVLTVVGTILIEVEVHGEIPSKVLFPFVMFAWLFFLFKGVRWLWLFTLGISVLGLAGDAIFGSVTWHGLALGLIEAVLLLLAPTRRYFAREPAPAAP